MDKNIIYMKIGDLSKISGVSRYLIHHYLRIGLLPPPEKKNETMAYYGEEHLERLKQIKSMRKEGFSLYIIEQILSKKSIGEDFPFTTKKSVVSRQSRKDKESKRQEIIKAAGKIFSEKGYFQTNISDITDELGIGKSSFYLSFKNKKEVFLACIDDIFGNLWKEDFVRIREETNMSSRLRLRGEAFIRVYPRIKDILQLVRGASVGSEEGIERKYNDIYAKLARPIISDLKRGMEQGVFPESDPELMAYILVGSLEAIAYRIHLDNKYTIEDGLKILRQFNFGGS